MVFVFSFFQTGNFLIFKGPQTTNYVSGFTEFTIPLVKKVKT